MSIRRIDSKYYIETRCPAFSEIDNVIEIQIKSGSGTSVPEDEPMFIFRAKDYLALQVLSFYLALCMQDNVVSRKIESIQGMISEFEDWQLKNSDKMKKPD